MKNIGPKEGTPFRNAIDSDREDICNDFNKNNSMSTLRKKLMR